MAEEYCSPCIQLQEESSDFYENGVTESVCNSLGQNTGFNPESGNNDCEDLKLANDCLILGNIEELDGYDVCKWKEFMETYLPNQYNMNEAIICAICGLWGAIQNQRLNNLAIETRYEIIQALPGMYITIDRQGNWKYDWKDWIVTGESEYGEGSLTGKVDFCFSIDEKNNVSWNIRSATILNYNYHVINASGAVTKPTHIVRIPDANGEIVFTGLSDKDYSVAVNKTVQFTKSGTLGIGQDSGWISFCNVYGDWVEDSSMNLQVKFINNNQDSVPIC